MSNSLVQEDGVLVGGDVIAAVFAFSKKFFTTTDYNTDHSCHYSNRVAYMYRTKWTNAE